MTSVLYRGCANEQKQIVAESNREDLYYSLRIPGYSVDYFLNNLDDTGINVLVRKTDAS